MNYTAEQVKDLSIHNFAFLNVQEADRILRIRLNRPGKKNALHPVLVRELAFALRYAHYSPSVRIVVLEAEGDVFCAGADLKAFMGESEPFESSIPEPRGEILIGELFKRLYKPSIALVEGHVFAGGFLILAGCNYVVAEKGIRLQLPEVKRGLFPFQVMAALLEIIPRRKVLDWCMRGYVLPPEKAEAWGLITDLVDKGQGKARTDELIGELLQGSPRAIQSGLKAAAELPELPEPDKHKYLYHKLMEAIKGPDAQEGLRAFKEKRDPVWPD